MAKVELQSARTYEAEPEKAAEELLRQLGGVVPRLVTIFAARGRDHTALNAAIRARLPAGTRILGASTAGEIDNTGIKDNSVVISAFTGDFEVGLGLGTGLTDDAVGAGVRAMEQAARDLGVRPADLDPKQCVGMVIDDGIRSKKEELLLGVLEKNPAITLVGGGANDPAFPSPTASGLVHVDGTVATDAVLVAVFRTKAPWAALRSHWYLPTGQTLKITKVDETCMRALEIDGKPAAKRYAELLGVSVEDLDFSKPNGFAKRPTALKVGREHFIRAPWQPLPDDSIVSANLLEEGTEFELMTLGDTSEMTRSFFTTELPRRVQNPKATVLFHCTARTWFAKSTGRSDALSETFRAAPPSVGFNVCFELYCGFNINTTLTALAFGENDA